MTDNSVKLRMLITLHALYKYTDTNHRMNSVRLNKFLGKLGGNAGYKSLSDTVNVLQSFGVKVAKNSDLHNHNVWIEDRPLPDPILQKLIFALRTNPYITQEHTEEVLESIRPVLTVYQEPMLETEFKDIACNSSMSLYEKYAVVQEAIRLGKTLRCTTSSGEQFTLAPKRLFRQNETVYVEGQLSTKSDTIKINISDLESAKLGRKSRRRQ